MTRSLQAGRAGAAKGEAERLVIFLHGYGANGADLLGLADPLAPHMPGTAFLAPDAPESCAGAPFGYQWFPVPWIDGSTEEASEVGMLRAVDDLNAWLDEVAAEEGVGPDHTILFGFSQGTMMALHVGPRRSPAYAGLVGFSGRLLRPELLEDDTVEKPPVLLVHGDADDVVPVQALPEAGNALTAAGFDVYAHVMKGTGHGIAPDGLSVALAFMQEQLGIARAE
ncbi:alpha/beta hydrolase [Rhodovulum adriaticum]|uniref:Phospholipase/carboxylesterase n=1 Tax=Rhodovulum adriaticum TaxID=35804 RepID=A0A4R2NNG3_RHOAD|nr:alpha/beta fold hydrolase [Rhodovulum adriaticum]MBK1634414.1 phospholipase [Rhodovulum adriaticum]TCP23217.1 phospholipase/carboxylesterase [Rhodovulum adriaticum]